jgi:hypothetical protein
MSETTITDSKTEDLSTDKPINRPKQWTEEWWEQAKPEVVARRCTAHKKNGHRCCKAAINGATVCRYHGGAAKHVRNAARIRLVNAADRMAKELLKMALDDNVADSVKLTAIRDALDRAGLAAKTEVEITARPFEVIFDVPAVESGKRDEYRKMLGIETAFECDGADLARYVGAPVLDVDEPEVIDDESDLVVEAEIDYLMPNQPQADDDERPSPFDLRPSAPPGTALVPYDEAVHQAAVLRTAQRR